MKLYFILFLINCTHYIETALRVLGGRDALKDEFPFAVRLEVLNVRNNIKEYIQFCTGAAIRSTWILTAGHCYAKEIQKMKQFARYNSYFPKSLGSRIAENDLGLFRCEKLSVASYAKISAVDYRSFIGHEALTLGFGRTNASAHEKPLQVLKVPSCGLVATICGGDSGGPVLHPSGVVGVNSMALNGCNEFTKQLVITAGTSANIIAMVSPHLNWIRNTISNKTYTTTDSINQTVATLRVLGGRDALKDEFPFAVRLEILTVGQDIEEYFRFCTGAAIRSTWILTAGHCYFKELDHPKVKSFARYNSYFPKFLGQISPLVEFLIHPSFSKNIENDLALFRCEKLSVASYAKISAVDYRTFVGHEALVLGFGGTNASEHEKPLQVLKGMLNKCLTNDVYTKHMMCLIPSCGLVATICGGDSGGPVLHPSGVVGVNSMSLDNCDEDTKTLIRTPGSSASIIAMVSPNINWIVNIISNKTMPT